MTTKAIQREVRHVHDLLSLRDLLADRGVAPEELRRYDAAIARARNRLQARAVAIHSPASSGDLRSASSGEAEHKIDERGGPGHLHEHDQRHEEDPFHALPRRLAHRLDRHSVPPSTKPSGATSTTLPLTSHRDQNGGNRTSRSAGLSVFQTWPNPCTPGFPQGNHRRKIPPVLGKVRVPTHRGNGSGPKPTTRLSEDRLALVQRYMVDAEEAEARAQAVSIEAENAAQAAAENAKAWAQRATEERARREAERARRNAEAAQREAARQQIRRSATKVEARPAPKVEASQPDRPAAARQAPPRAGKQLAKAERRAAEQAARVAASLEKREARERKALAKAADKQRKRLAKLSG
jgi:hypothetical protein